MGRFSQRSQGQLRTVSEINVTPLMDLTFLLLIVFMITAPVLEYETDVSPPEMETSKPIDEEKAPLMISLNKAGEIIFQKQVIALKDLGQKLEFLYTARPDVAVVIRADGEIQYKEIIGVMKTVRKTGIRDIKLATQPEQS